MLPCPLHLLPPAPTGTSASIPPTVSVNSSHPVVDYPTPSAPPLIGLDHTTPLVSSVPRPQAQVPANVAPATTHAPAGDLSLYDDNSSRASSASTTSGFHPNLIARTQVEYRKVDKRRIPCIQSLQFTPSTDRIVATQLLVRSILDTLSSIFDIVDPAGTVTLDSSACLPFITC